MEDHKNFLFRIFEKENPKWVEDQLNKKNSKLNKIKKDWIEFSKLHQDSMEDDDLFMKELAPTDGISQQSAGQTN